MASMRKAPPGVLSSIEAYSDLINTPRIGNDANFAFATSQLNIAPAQAYESGM